jgi:flagellar hook-length control protein FliK
MPQRASSVPAVPARPATDRAVAPPAEARSGSAPTAAGDEKPAAIIPAAPPTPAPNPLVAVQAALATMGDATPDPAHAIASTNDAATTPIAERVMGHQLDLARDSAWLDRLARDIAGSADSDGPMRFRLHPDTLGQMRVELSQSDRGTSVRLTVETETARSLVADAQPKLVAEARAQGVRIAETHVDLAGGSGGQASSDPRRQEAAREPVFVRTAHPAADGGEAENRPRRGRGERYA